MTSKEKAQLRTKAHVTLYLADVSQGILLNTYGDVSEAEKQLNKIRRWIDECWDKALNGKPSAGALREMDVTTERIDEIRRSVLDGDCVTPQHWAAWMLAVSTLLNDVYSTWDQARHTRHWRYLVQTFRTFENCFLAQVDSSLAEEQGQRIYEAVYRIMPGSTPRVEELFRQQAVERLLAA